MRTLLILFTVSACTAIQPQGDDTPSVDAPGGSGSGTNEHNISGSRIKMSVIRGADGSKVYLGQFDSLRGEDCMYQPTSDGKTRCTPYVALTASYFADAACTVPVAFYSTCYQAPKYMRSPTPVVACGAVATVAPIHERGAAVAQAYSLNSAGTCVMLTASPTSIYYLLGAEVPASEFAEGVSEVE